MSFIEEQIQAELWRKKLAASGFKIIEKPKDLQDPDSTGEYKKVQECQKCGTMSQTVGQNGLCPHCAPLPPF